MKPKTLVVSGPPRSGTTLLYNLFDGHPSISWMAQEGYFFEYLFDCGPGNEDIYCELSERDIQDLILGIRDRGVLPDIAEGYRQLSVRTMDEIAHYKVDWSEATFVQKLKEAPVGPQTRVEALWLRLALAYLAGFNTVPADYICLKAPDYGKSAFSAVSHIPDARAIVILRDPIAALDSLKGSREKRQVKRLVWPTMALAVSQYRMLAERLVKNSQERIMAIRYEDLVSDTESTMKGIASWLGIDYQGSLVEPTFKGQAWAGHSSRKETTGIDKELMDREIKHLTAVEVTQIKAKLAATWEPLGYEL